MVFIKLHLESGVEIWVNFALVKHFLPSEADPETTDIVQSDGVGHTVIESIQEIHNLISDAITE